MFCASLSAQSPLEAGLFLGTTTYQGDLAENHVEPNEMHFAFGGHLRYHFHEKLKMRGNVIYGHISGRDTNAKNEGLYNRGWSFTSHIVEMSLALEYHPFGKPREDNVGFYRRQVTPFVAGGIGLANFAPTVKTVRPADAGRFPERGYSTSSLTVPVMAGVTFDFSEDFLLSLEAGSRLTFNDYLDGVSKNGNPKKGDLFIFVGISINYYINYREVFFRR